MEGAGTSHGRQTVSDLDVAEEGRCSRSSHLFLLLMLAEAMGLREGILMCPEQDMPSGVDLEVLRRSRV